MNWESFYRDYRKPDYIPGYQLLNKLGGGVFGFVYKARKQSIGKNYAIKFLKVDDEDVKKAVMHELEAIKFFAQVDHPHLVSIEDKGEVDGIPFIIMGYAGEETLKKRLEQRHSDEGEALAVFKQILSGVAALHEKSIIHFDLKPGNIFLKGDFARVGDYGLSRLMSESRKTLSFGRGTPYYMAPELLKKKGDNRSDIYSLGVILFECLTGKVPFQGDSEWEVLKKHEEEEVSFPPHVSEPLRQVIRKMMAKKPEDRYQAVKDTLSDLERIGSGAESHRGSSREPEREGRRRRGRDFQKWTVGEDLEELARAAQELGKEAVKMTGGIKVAVVQADVGKKVKEVGVRGVQASRTIGDHLRNHMLIPLYDGIDGFREGLMSLLVGNGQSARRARSLERKLPEGTDVRQRPKSTLGLFFRSFFQTIQVVILAALVPIRYIGTGVKEVIEFVLKLPFRVFGFLARVVLVLCGFSVIFLMIFALVYIVVHIPRFMMLHL